MRILFATLFRPTNSYRRFSQLTSSSFRLTHFGFELFLRLWLLLPNPLILPGLSEQLLHRLLDFAVVNIFEHLILLEHCFDLRGSFLNFLWCVKYGLWDLFRLN